MTPRYTINRVTRDIDMWMSKHATLEDALRHFAVEYFDSSHWILDFDRKMVIAVEEQVPGYGPVAYCVCPVETRV